MTNAVNHKPPVLKFGSGIPIPTISHSTENCELKANQEWLTSAWSTSTWLTVKITAHGRDDR